MIGVDTCRRDDRRARPSAGLEKGVDEGLLVTPSPRDRQAEWTGGEANPRFLVTSLKAGAWTAKLLYEDLYCARGEMENRLKEA